MDAGDLRWSSQRACCERETKMHHDLGRGTAERSGAWWHDCTLWIFASQADMEVCKEKEVTAHSANPNTIDCMSMRHATGHSINKRPQHRLSPNKCACVVHGTCNLGDVPRAPSATVASPMPSSQTCFHLEPSASSEIFAMVHDC